MESLLTTIPNTFTGWIITLILSIGGVSYVFKNVRARDMKELRDFNHDLLQKTDYLEKKVEALEKDNKELNSKVKSLEKHSKTLEDLVVTALKQFFLENPQLAKDLNTVVIGK